MRATTLCLLALSLPASAQSVLEETFNPENGRRYLLLSPSSWTAAEAAAVAMGGHLATVRSYAEEHFLLESFQNPSRQAFWIGLNDASQEGVYVWSSGESAAYRDWNQTWYPGSGAPSADYVAMNLSWYQQHWEEVDDGSPNRHGIVELAVPEILASARNPSNGHHYYLLGADRWTRLQAFAETLGGNLATVRDAAEQGWLVANFGSWNGRPIDFFIGLNDRAVQGSWRWAAGGGYGYTSWAPGEPSNAAGEDHALVSAGSGSWNDVTDDAGNGTGAHGVMEIDRALISSGGSGCSNCPFGGAGYVELRAFQISRPGREVVLRWEDDRGPSFMPVWFAGGISNTSWLGTPLPIPVPGSPGCVISVSLDVFVQGAGVSGWYARLPIPLIDEPWAFSIPTYWQAMTFGFDSRCGLLFGSTNWVSVTN